jgi:glycosyltransferase involved in cell wall biosynthesis
LYKARARLLPNGVDVGRFAEVSEADLRAVRSRYGLSGDVVLSMGLYAYRPNGQAIDALVEKIFPEVLRRRPRAKLAILGGAIPHERPWLLTPGSIPYEELPGFVSACAAGVAPIISGSGTRLKLLEYLAAGLPAVSTAKGAEGLPLRDGRHLLIAEGAACFADAISSLLVDPGYAASLARRGQSLVREKYAWSRIMADCWTALHARLVDPKAGRTPWTGA